MIAMNAILITKKYYMNPFIFVFALGVIFYVLGSLGGRKIVDISNQLYRSGGGWGRRSTSSISDITIHHSATSTRQTAQDFARYHVDKKGWPGIGYHFVINRDGSILKTNSIDTNSYHNGYNNTVAIGICLVGDFTMIIPSGDQIKSCIFLCKKLKKDYKSIKYLVGHKEYGGGTLCPGRFPLDMLRQKTRLYVRQNKSLQIVPFNYDDEEADN